MTKDRVQGFLIALVFMGLMIAGIVMEDKPIMVGGLIGFVVMILLLEFFVRD